MKMNKLSLSLSALACALLMLAGCKKDPVLSTSAEITAAKIVITPAVAATETTPAVDEVSVEGVINSSAATIEFTMEQGASISALVPVFTLAEDATMDYDGTSPVDFTKPFTVNVTAGDGETVKAWTVTVDNSGFALSDKKAIEKFSFANVDGVINEEEKTIKLVLPQNTNLSAIAPTIVISDYATVTPASGESVNFKFISTKVYTVTAEDGSKAEYTVEVTAPHSGCDIESFTIGVGDVTISTGAETNTIDIVLPAGTKTGTYTPKIEVSEGATVSPASGVAQNFTSPVTYTVTAENGSTKSYTVTVKETVACEAFIEKVWAFTLTTTWTTDLSQTGQNLFYGEIDYAAKTVTFYYNDPDEDLSSVEIYVYLSEADATVSPDGTENIDFTNPNGVAFTITDEKGVTDTYTIKFVYYMMES